VKKTPIWLACAVALVGLCEGLRTSTYLDIGGVATICYGETQGVTEGETRTKEDCDRLLGTRLREFNAEISKCLPADMPETRRAALNSLAYNIGSDAFCKSTVAKRMRSGDIQGACDAFLMWNRAGGKVVKGLTNRRERERELCLL
jgi:lysozyme